jgi:hypothetical protein
MAISNGYDTDQVMAALFGRVQWRSLNPGGSYPLNFQVNATRADFFLKVGTSAGMIVGGSTYTDPTSSLKGWTYSLEQLGYGTLQPGVDYSVDPTTGNFTLLNGGTFALNQRFVLHFQPQTASAPGAASGRFYEFFHPLCTLDNFRAVQETVGLSDVDFQTMLSDVEQGVIMSLLNGVFNEPQMIESTLIFDRQLRNDIPYTPAGKFCGYRLFIAPGEFAMQISRASFIFNGDAQFNLYLFQDMKKNPLYTIPVTVVGGDETYVDLPDWILHYTGPQAQGGVYYLGYFQNDLGPVLALDQFVNRWNESLAFGYTAFEAVQPDLTVYDFIRIQVPYTYRTYGMNLEIQTYKDFTNRIVKNASLFDELIGLATATVVLGYEAYSTRSNSKERITKEMAAQIYGELMNSGEGKDVNPYIAGLKQQVKRELSRIHRNFFGDRRIQTTRPPIWGTEGLQGVFP